MTRYLCIAGHADHAERFVDFSSIQNIPLERLLRSDRLFGIGTQKGLVTFLQRFASFVGSDERRQNMAPGDPNLLQAARDAIARRT